MIFDSFSVPRFAGYHRLDAVLLFHTEELPGGRHHLCRHFHGGSPSSENGLEIKK